MVITRTPFEFRIGHDPFLYCGNRMSCQKIAMAPSWEETRIKLSILFAWPPFRPPN